MRVRILSGNQTGVITEVSEPEGEHLLMSQLAELVPIEAAADDENPRHRIVRAAVLLQRSESGPASPCAAEVLGEEAVSWPIGAPARAGAGRTILFQHPARPRGLGRADPPRSDPR